MNHNETLAKPVPSLSASAKIAKKTDVFVLSDLITGQLGYWALALLLGIATVIATIGLLMLSGWFVSATALAGVAMVGVQGFNYFAPSVGIRAFAILRTVGRYGELMVSHHAIFKLLQNLRVRFFNQFAKLLPRQLPTDIRSTHAMHRLTHDIDVLNEFVLRVVSPWIQAILVVVILSGLMLWQLPVSMAWRGALVGLLWLVSLLIPLYASVRAIKLADNQHTLAEKRRISLLEPLSALTHLLLWERWQAELDKFLQKDLEYETTQRHAQRQRGFFMLSMQWGLASLLLLGLYAIAQNKWVADTPLILAWVLGVLALTEIVLPLASNYLAYGNSVSAKNRLNRLLDSPSTRIEPTISKKVMGIDQVLANQSPLQLQVNRLTAKMPKAVVGFTDLTFNVTQDKPLLITGASGAGKSTLLQVLADEILPQSGEITLNTVDWQHIDWQKNGQSQLGYLGQQIDIFDQTLAQNLRLGKADATDEELWQVLDDVGLKAWAQHQPQQLNTRLGEYGMAVSGGQARRIALARVLLTPKVVLMLDEPFAGLDADSRERLWHNLVERQRNGLLIVVTHQVWQSADSVTGLTLPDPVVVD